MSQSGDIFGPNYFMDQDVILVTFNYRVSVLGKGNICYKSLNKVIPFLTFYPTGFLSTGDSQTVANLALRDQIQALKWIQLNIGAFFWWRSWKSNTIWW